MDEIVLEHGALALAPGAWEELAPHLEDRGLTVTAPDLPIAEPFDASVDVVV
ncbi:MAG: hypothetical protein U5O39_12935 [Gammaproteobacteria bacterium]|nr:hypothetical protein [Gammaproteobacteria bacterium]